MNIIKNFNSACESILNKLFFSILIIIQLTVSLYFVHSGICTVDKQLSEIQRIEKIFNIENIYSMQSTDEISNLMSIKFRENDILQRCKDFNDFLENSTDFTAITYNNDVILAENFKNCQKFKNNNVAEKEIESKSYEGLYAINGDKSFFENFNFDMDSGRFFENEDFNSNDLIPVILGYGYNDYFKIDDTINYFDEYKNCEKKLKVIGFLQKDTYFYEHTLSPDSVFNLNNYIVFPIQPIDEQMDKENLKIKYLSKFSDVVLISDKESSSLQNIIQSKSNELNLINVQIQSGKSMINSYKDIANTQKKFSITIFVIILLFASINVIATFVNYILKRKKEFGIHILCGATIQDIFERIFIEVAILITSSYALMFIVNYLLNRNEIVYTPKSIIITTVIAILLIFLLSIIPIISICKIKFNTLMRED